MDPDRRPYQRETEDRRRDALIAAVLELVAEGGTDAATVRAIAERAGVTPGLVRHYFGDKDSLMRAAYARMMEAMVAPSAEAAEAAGDAPVARLRAFLSTALDAGSLDGRTVSVWAAYIHQTRHDPAMRAAHEQGYLAFRDRLEGLIAALPRCAMPPRPAAIALNAMLDGLWLEAGLLPQGFAAGEVQAIAMTSAARLLDIPELATPKGPMP